MRKPARICGKEKQRQQAKECFFFTVGHFTNQAIVACRTQKYRNTAQAQMTVK
jgi:hypothetical protein